MKSFHLEYEEWMNQQFGNRKWKEHFEFHAVTRHQFRMSVKKQQNEGNRRYNVKQRETKLEGCTKTRKTKNGRKWLNYVCTLKKKKKVKSKRRRKRINGLNRCANFFFLSPFASFAYRIKDSLRN